MPAIVSTNLSVDPTDPNQAQVTGIAVPKQPAAMGQVSKTQVDTGTQASGNPPIVTAPGGIAPTAGVTPYTPPPQDLPPLQDTGVQNRVAAITSEDSPLMQQARTAGLQTANARGVLNSSIAAGASENSAISAALPIATQEANNAQQSNTQRYQIASGLDQLAAQAGYGAQAAAQQYSYTAALNTSGYAFQQQQQANQNAFQQQMAAINQGYSVNLANLQSTLQSKLQAQANDEQIGRMGVDLANQLTLQSNQATNALAQIKAQGDIQLTQQANQFAEALKELTLNLNENNSVAAANSAVNLFNAQMGLRSALMSNTSMPASERSAYETAIGNMAGPVQNYVAQLLGYAPGAATTPTPPAPPPPTTTGIAPPPSGTPTNYPTGYPGPRGPYG